MPVACGVQILGHFARVGMSMLNIWNMISGLFLVDLSKAQTRALRQFMMCWEKVSVMSF